MSSTPYQISAIAAFSDNYVWAITHHQNNDVALVDPGDGEACLAYIKANNLTLTDIIITHHHQDHVGGINILRDESLRQGQQVTVYSPQYQPLADQAKLPIPQKKPSHSDVIVSAGDTLSLPHLELSLKVIDISGHTLEHVGYVNEQLIFCGDALFSAGCGRRFEGSVAQMFNALKTLSTLPPALKVYCAHEYTLSNIEFALAVEPNNQALKQYQQQIIEKRHNGKASLPSTISTELAINPFLRTNKTEVIASTSKFANTELNTEQEVFNRLRQWKDIF